MKKVVHFEVHFVILYSKTELLKQNTECFFIRVANILANNHVILSSFKEL